MKYRHCKRSGVGFLLLGIITLEIYPIVVLSHVRKEVNELNANNGVKKQMPFLLAYLLGFITCGIVPLVWCTRMAGKIQIAALERGITSPRLTKAFFACWIIFGSYIIVGPFIAYHRFFKVLNRVEAYENEKLASEAKSVEIKDEMKDEMDGNLAPVVPTAPLPEAVETKAPEAPYPNLPSPEAKEPAPVKTTYSSVPSPAPAASSKPWRVKVNGVTKVFASREEAVAYAQKISAERRALRRRS